MKAVTCVTLNKISHMKQTEQEAQPKTSQQEKSCFFQDPYEPFFQTYVEIQYWEKSGKEKNSPSSLGYLSSSNNIRESDKQHLG